MKHYECRACAPDGDADPCTLSYHEDTGEEPVECPYGRGSEVPQWKLVDPDGKKDWRIEFNQDWIGGTIQLADVYTGELITWVAGIDLISGALFVNPDLQSDLEDGGYTTGKLQFTNGLLETRTP